MYIVRAYRVFRVPLLNCTPPQSKAEVLKKAKVIIPDGFAGLRKSYTLDLDTSKVQVLWHEAGIYVKTSTGAGGFKVDGKGGTTISIRKYGGWRLSWISALRCAGVV